MTTPETRARIRGLEQQLAAATPPPLDGQIAIPLTWRQEPLWEAARTIPAPAEPKRPQRRTRARIRALPRYVLPGPTPPFLETARPATRAHGWYLGRRIRHLNTTGNYL